MKLNEILNNIITFNICYYLDFISILNLRLTNKYIKSQIDKTPKYNNIYKIINKSKSGYKSIIKKTNKMLKCKKVLPVDPNVIQCPLVVNILICTVFSPIILPILAIKLLCQIDDCINDKILINDMEKSYKHVKSLYIWSLTSQEYIQITKSIINKYPELLYDINCTSDRKDLLICIQYGNYATLNFLLEKIQMQSRYNVQEALEEFYKLSRYFDFFPHLVVY